LVPSSDSGDDFVWVLGPGKGLWVRDGMSTGAFPYQTASGSGDAYDFGLGDCTQAAIGGVLG